MKKEIVVSIVCNAYNHGQYIKKALDGFIMQRTNFDFEVLIHDDASTDNTADIIREYEKKYPDIIKPIYQTENQYSKHDGSLARIQYSRVRGKYIALCEGDDYWVDPLKLQKQYDALEQHPECNICASASYTEMEGKIVGKVEPAQSNSIFSLEEVILGGGAFVGTATLMYRSDIRDNPPSFFNVINLDYVIQIYGALHGGMIYLAEPMSVYRLSTSGSWTIRMQNDYEKQRQHNELVEKMLVCLDEDTNFLYHECIDKKIRINRFAIAYSQNDYATLLLPEYKDIFSQQKMIKKIFIMIGAKIPFITNSIKKVIR